MDGALRATSDQPNRLGKLRQTLDARLTYTRDLEMKSTRVGLRLCLAGRTEADFAYLMNADAYDRPTRELYGSQLLVRETFLALELSGFELAFGRQVVNFGQGEMLSALDVVNPRDLREPLLADVADLRMPVLMTRASWTRGRLRLEALVVHEPYFGLLPPPLGEFSPFRKLLLDNATLATALAGRTVRNSLWPAHDVSAWDATQFHGRATWSGTGFDLALHAASVLDGLGVPGLPSPAAFAQEDIAFPIYHPRYAMLGHSGALTTGNFVFRWETALDLARSLALRERDAALLTLSARRFHQAHAMLGLTYVPDASTSAALELSQSYVFDNPARSSHSSQAPLWPVEAPQLALRASHRFLADRASVALLLVWIGALAPNAWVARGEFGYAFTDTLHASLGAITYQPSARFGPFYGFSHHERVFLSVRWDFSS